MNFNKKDRIEIAEQAMSWIVTLAMMVYGAGKIIQFDGATAIDKKVSQLTGMQLMWAFYGYSKPYVVILGFMEITGGIMLLFKKSRIIGCLFLSAILVNIILQDIFFHVHVGALKTAILYQTLLLAILWINKDIVIKSIKSLTIAAEKTDLKTKFYYKILITFILFVLLRIIEFYMI
ncbi:putative membrane protein [Flavobacterium sp. 28A]|uniref:hypothetical protein n=1 Tax=Flavobacterium sp. 28A TaxID=2735895 RepID=UPI00156DE7F2|nr:hypothetical protein [Flavobacterium sp. 28A]NRT14077.1 putative membrane protein [Flavobacterium sp. 28A]